MINKKIIMYIFIIIAVCFIAIIGIFMVFNSKRTNEYIPPEEFSVSKTRETIITLYFYNINENKIQIENIKIDSKELLKEPYKKILNLLIEEKNSDLKSIIPENIKIENVNFNKGILYIDFSEEFEKISYEECKNIINILLKVFNQLNDFQGLKVTVKLNEIENFDGKIRKILTNEIT